GLGMVGNEFSLGTTVYLDQKKMWSAATTFSLEFHTDKSGTDINVGDLGTFEGGLGRKVYKKSSGPIPIIMNLGADYYAQFKVTGDSGSDIPPALRGYKDRVFGIGPEFNVYLPKPRLTLLARYEPEFGARNRTQGQTVVFSIAWVAKSLVKMPPPPASPPQSSQP
ncbi:MAG: transporter, partial [Candidatus Korobacteraceae bacterium]